MTASFDTVLLAGGAATPSYDYFLRQRLSDRAIALLPMEDETLDVRTPFASARRTLLLVCRGLPVELRPLLSRRNRWAGIVWFVDDDFTAMVKDGSLPARYRRRIQREAVAGGRRLLRAGAEMLVATERLQARWRAHGPRRLRPLHPLQPPPPRPADITLAYHGTAAHAREQRWLMPVVRTVLAADPGVRFELVLDASVARAWEGHPRVRLRAQLPWDAYREDTARAGRHILLAPLAPSPVNAARTYTKRFDAARCGAALLVSDREVYQPSGAEERAGMLLPWDQRAWVRAILALLAEPERIDRLSALNREFLEAANARAEPLIEPAGAGESGSLWRLAA